MLVALSLTATGYTQIEEAVPSPPAGTCASRRGETIAITGEYPSSGPPLTSTSPQPSRTAEAAKRRLHLDAELWRDFQPISEKGGRPLTAVFTVTADGKEPFPEDLVVSELRVRYVDNTWVTRQLNETSPPASNAVQRVAHGGPKWEPGVEVDVEVLVESSESVWLVECDVRIGRTE